jgi:Trypsin-co-occurring domain 2
LPTGEMIVTRRITVEMAMVPWAKWAGPNQPGQAAKGVTMNNDANEAQQEVSELSGEIDAVVGDVKRAILEVEKDASSGGSRLTIKEADLTLRAVLTKDIGGDFKFKLFGHEFGGGVELTKADTQTIEIKLAPSAEDAMTFGAEEVSEKLVTALRAIRASVSSAAAAEPRFTLSEASVELNFEVDKDGKINFIIAGEGKKTNAQTVKLTLAGEGANTSPS